MANVHDLTKWLTLLHNDSRLKMSWKVIPVEVYKEKWESMYPYCDSAKIPIFFSKNVDLGEVGQNLQNSYVEVSIENAGYKQQHDYLLTSITRHDEKITLAFTSEFSNWGSKRLVILIPERSKVYRNDFKGVYELSWKDYREEKYQKKESTPHVTKLRRPKRKP